MLPHENSDDDEDDYEGYFLQPVNGYKIADKIIIANKELFESEPDGQSAATAPTDTVVGLNQLRSPSTSVENSSDSQRRVTFRPDLEDFEPEFITDVEDDDVDEDASVSDDAEVIDMQSAETTDKPTIPILSLTTTTSEMSMSDLEKTEIEEICEEIEDFSLADGASCAQLPVAVEPHQDTSDKTDTDDDKEQPVEPNSTTSPIDGQAADASEAPLRHLRTPSFQRSDSERSGSSQRPHRHHHEHNRRASASGTSTAEGDFLKIQLNFKPCCEYKTVENNRLPRYSGYFSQYGLSKEQLELRDLLRERSHRRKYQRIERKSEEEMLKSQVNEEAFARWLQVKMKSAQSSTRNMYDYHAKQAKKSKKKA